MSWYSIPAYVPVWLHRHPYLLTKTLAAINTPGLAKTIYWRWKLLVVVIVLLVSSILGVFLTSKAGVLGVRVALDHAGLVIIGSGLYAMSLVIKTNQKARVERVRSWLIATPRHNSHSIGSAILPIVLPLGWRYLGVLAILGLLAFRPAIAFEQVFQLAAAITIAGGVGAGFALVVPRRRKPHYESSRYIRRPKPSAGLLPSSAALSHWPIAQALAWSRPENSRFLLAAALLSAPSKATIVGALALLAIWVLVSYLMAVLAAIPYVGRAAVAWLKVTPISFWSFAWSLSRRAILHQLCATAIVVLISLHLGQPFFLTGYLAALWMTIVVMLAAISLASCYRGRSSSVKTTLSIAGVLAIEGIIHGLGIVLGLLLMALHLRIGSTYERT